MLLVTCTVELSTFKPVGFITPDSPPKSFSSKTARRGRTRTLHNWSVCPPQAHPVAVCACLNMHTSQLTFSGGRAVVPNHQQHAVQHRVAVMSPRICAPSKTPGVMHCDLDDRKMTSSSSVSALPVAAKASTKRTGVMCSASTSDNRVVVSLSELEDLSVKALKTLGYADEECKVLLDVSNVVS